MRLPLGKIDDHYSTIVVGAGSAGCVVAARLSEDADRSVLLLEAGRYFGAIDAYPWALRTAHSMAFSLPGSPYGWPLMATLTPEVTYPITRGKVVGGSSAVNGAIFMRGHRHDFEAWQCMVNEEWSFAEVLPWFRKLETDLDFGSTEIHGATGPMRVRRPVAGQLAPVSAAFLDACSGLGYPSDGDLNGPSSIGVGLLPTNLVDGVRLNTGAAYLEPVLARKNLTLVDECLAHQVLFTGRRVSGVRATQRGLERRISGAEVVLCAGGIKSPQLLMLSGIGPPETLHELDIPLVEAAPAVGRNLMDHPTVKVSYRTDHRPSLGPHPMAEVALHHDVDSSGTGEIRIHPYVYTSMNMLFGVLPGQRLGDRLRSLAFLGRPVRTVRGVWGMSPQAFRHDVATRHDMALSCGLGIEESRGRLVLSSKDPLAPPVVDLNYLSERNDVRRLTEAVRIAIEILDTQEFRRLGAILQSPSSREARTDGSMADWLVRHVGTAFHSSCTCRMGPEPGSAVVDPHCRVYGVEGLRIADLSVLPRLVRRPPHATALMIGERVAEFIRRDDR